MFDLLVVDHPALGDAAHVLVDLCALLKSSEWQDLEDDAVGQSFDSYVYERALYALPVDAAAPAASYRPDLLAAAQMPLPIHWSEVLDLARRQLVRMPGFPVDLFLNFMGMCVSRGSLVAGDWGCPLG